VLPNLAGVVEHQFSGAAFKTTLAAVAATATKRGESHFEIYHLDGLDG
jgi:hypothetical protein